MTTEEFNKSVNEDIARRMEIVQRSDEWFESKLGRVGASRISDIMAEGTGASRKNYMMELLCQRLTGRYEESYTSPAMQWGIDNEDLARSIYELETGYTVRQVGGYPHPTIPMAGASPDGVVIEGGKEIGLVEIKCPNTASHIDFLETRKIPKKYQYQMAFQILCSRLPWCDFVSYDPRMPSKHQIAIERFKGSEEMFQDIETKVRAFVEELDELERRFK